MRISVADVKDLLPAFGYTPKLNKDDKLIEICIDRVLLRVRAFTHLTIIPDELCPEVIRMITGEFLYTKKTLGGLEDGGISFPRKVSQITEGDTSLSLSGVTKPEDDFDAMVDTLRRGDPHILEHWRALHW